MYFYSNKIHKLFPNCNFIDRWLFFIIKIKKVMSAKLISFWDINCRKLSNFSEIICNFVYTCSIV